VVLLDADALVLRSLDEAVDLLLDRAIPADAASHIMYHPENPVPDDIWVLFTNDYGIVEPAFPVKPVQGGFAILKPNRTIYEEIVDIVREGNFNRSFGWGTREAHTGRFHGAQTFQGLMPYYFSILKRSKHHVVLNWCQYNHQNVQPLSDWYDPPNQPCWDGRKTCEDCRERPFESLYTVHFTVCKKPWRCRTDEDSHHPDKVRLCAKTHRAWFAYRSEMERSWGRTGLGSSASSSNATLVEKFRGYCSGFGPRDDKPPAVPEYEPIRLPYGGRGAASAGGRSDAVRAIG
jgi:hypothetical protein